MSNFADEFVVLVVWLSRAFAVVACVWLAYAVLTVLSVHAPQVCVVGLTLFAWSNVTPPRRLDPTASS